MTEKLGVSHYDTLKISVDWIAYWRLTRREIIYRTLSNNMLVKAALNNLFM